MNIIADENIAFAKEAFSSLGEVTLLPDTEIHTKCLKNADILLVRSKTVVDKKLLEGTSVKYVASATVGIDHVDRNYLKDRNIGFSHAPGSNTGSVAEYIITAILSLTQNQNRDLSSLTLGNIGVGNIGRRVLNHAESLGIRCLQYDPPRMDSSNTHLYSSLEDILKYSDIISLHVPLISEGPFKTRHLVNDAFMDSIRKKAILINTSRGDVIDPKSLISKRNRLNGLVLDVWDNEPSINTSLLEMTDIATPHIAGLSFDGKLRGTKAIHESIHDFFNIKPDWSLPEDIHINPRETIEIGGGRDPLVTAVTGAFPIDRDNQKFKEILQLGHSSHKEYFNQLRRYYPKRLEFSHYNVKLHWEDQTAADTLRAIGFSTVNT